MDPGIDIGGAFSAVIPLVSLHYGGVMQVDVENPTRVGQDPFVLSKGHAVASMASIYADLGYFGREVLENSRSMESTLNGHPGPLPLSDRRDNYPDTAGGVGCVRQATNRGKGEVTVNMSANTRAGQSAIQPCEINQVGMVVEDLEKTAAAYWRLFGIGPWDVYNYSSHCVRRFTYRGREVQHEFRLAMAMVGSLGLELIEIGSGPTIYRDHVEKHGYGIHHIGVYSSNTKQAIEEAAALGLAMIQSGEGLGPNGDGHYAYIDTEKLLGVIIEFREPPTKRRPPDMRIPS